MLETVFAGCSFKAKRQLYKEIVDNMKIMAGIDPLDVFIIMNDIFGENLGILGVQRACEANIGFKAGL